MSEPRDPYGAALPSLHEVHRQLDPGRWNFQKDRPQRDMFKPRASDHGLLSLTNGIWRSAQEAYEFARTEVGLDTMGVGTVHVEDFEREGVDVYADPLMTPRDDLDDPAHAAADYRALSNSKTSKVSMRIRDRALVWRP